MKIAVITDHTVKALYGEKVQALYPEESTLFSFPEGEQWKNRTTKEALEDQLLEAGYGRDTVIVGLGGGVVSDVAGFLASTFCRGVGLVLIPTTLLAMVDACIGGKNGVNTPHGKNMIGSLYVPHGILLDERFLLTLPETELYNGKVEMIKHALLGNPSLLPRIQQEHIPSLTLIQDAIEVKRRIIAQDLSERGLRHMLNVGHTIGHALELLSDYQISHGKAVATGILIESHFAYRSGILAQTAWDTIQTLFSPASIPFSYEEMESACKKDKKSREGEIHFSVLQNLGEPFEGDGDYCVSFPSSLLKEVLHAYLHPPALLR